MAGRDPELERVRDAMIDNFMAAIKEGHLVVEGIAQGNHWTLDAETLPKFAKGLPEANAFYHALLDPAPAEKEIKNVGKVRLYINTDDSLDKKLHTITMRKPLMKIDTFRHNSISAKYAAVLVCDSTEGNKFLRQLEPPQHHEWDAERDRKNGKKVIRDLKAFVRESLRERITTKAGDEVTIDGLSRFLPVESAAVDTSGKPSVHAPKPDEKASDKEASTVTGKTGRQKPAPNKPGAKVRVTVSRPTSKGDPKGDPKDKRTSDGDKKPGKPSKPGKDGEGNNPSFIRGQDVTFRSWSTQTHCKDSSVIALAITADKTETGDLELVALDSEGKPEKKFNLSVSRAVLHCSGQPIDIKYSGNILKNLTLKGGQRTRIDIYMPAGERYRLGVA